MMRSMLSRVARFHRRADLVILETRLILLFMLYLYLYSLGSYI